MNFSIFISFTICLFPSRSLFLTHSCCMLLFYDYYYSWISKAKNVFIILCVNVFFIVALLFGLRFVVKVHIYSILRTFLLLLCCVFDCCWCVVSLLVSFLCFSSNSFSFLIQCHSVSYAALLFACVLVCSSSSFFSLLLSISI